MRHHCYSGIIQVQPGGNLAIGHDEDVSHPGGVLLHRAQRIAELLVVFESTRRYIFILLRLRGKCISDYDATAITETLKVITISDIELLRWSVPVR